MLSAVSVAPEVMGLLMTKEEGLGFRGKARTKSRQRGERVRITRPFNGVLSRADTWIIHDEIWLSALSVTPAHCRRRRRSSAIELVVPPYWAQAL